MMPNIKLEHKFDPIKYRHYLNNNLTVLHCHHYATLFTQLAIDAKDIVDGTRILIETAEDVFYKLLSDYYVMYNCTEVTDKIEIAVKMFSAIGMGKMNLISVNETNAEIELPFAYLDEGWMQKWGKSDFSVNFIARGYIAGMFSAIFGKPVRTYNTVELQSIVTGAEKSIIKITM